MPILFSNSQLKRVKTSSTCITKKAAKKSFFSGRTTKKGVKGRTTKRITFFEARKKKIEKM